MIHVAPPPVAHGEFDFETYSEAGHVWNETTRKWVAPKGARKKGLGVVGASVYTEHPSAEVLTLSYELPHYWNGGGLTRRWRPGLPNPQDLFDYLAAGGLLEAHNVMFERLVWHNICVPKYGWPPLEPHQYQLRCSMAKARVNSLPGALGNLSAVLQLATPKDADGKRLLDKFSVPRNPTKPDPRLRITPAEDPAEAERLYGYCDTDLKAERGASTHPKMSPMSADELLFWQVDQEINWRGVGVDRAGIRDCIAILDQALVQYGAEFKAITGLDATQLAATMGWLAGRRCYMQAMDEEAVTDALKRPLLPPDVRRVLQIRQLIGSASVKKLYAMELQASRDDRLRNLIVHHGARTGRPTGEGPQPLNLPKAGPKLVTCAACARPHRQGVTHCLWCAALTDPAARGRWAPEMADHVLEIMASRSLPMVEWFFGDALLAISGCIRSLFRAGPGNELIASDYSAIEAVVTAMLADETWRIETFRARKDIYLVSAAKITGRTELEYAQYELDHGGDKHPDRQKIGKVSELGLGFGGWLGAWRQFDDSDNFSDEQVKANILAWRDASPRIVEMWGGQHRGRPWDRNRVQEYYGFEGCAVQAILHPGQVFTYAGIRFQVRDRQPAQFLRYWENDGVGFTDVETVPEIPGKLVITLLSGRELTYHDPRLTPSSRSAGEWAITYWTWNSNPKYGAMGWVCMSTFGGRLAENIIQATAHDILRFGILNLRAAGYPTVLHVYDECVVEIPAGTGSIQEVERLLGIMPAWAKDWPIRATGGWRGVRYRKG